MKKFIASLFLSFFVIVSVLSQGCLSEGITFTSQSQINDFPVNYPDCNEIEGYLKISGDDIINLEGLENLTSITGDLELCNNLSLTSLSGLDNLTEIGQNLWISMDNDLGPIPPVGNPSLADLSALNNLTSIGGDVVIELCDVLSNLNGLDNISSIGGELRIGGNDALTSFESLNNLIHIEGSLSLNGPAIGNDGNPSLTNLSAFSNLISIGGDLEIGAQEMLTSLNEFENLTSIGGDIYIEGSNSLTSLSGLENIDAGSIENLYIHGNSSLSDCEVQSLCDYLAAPNGTVEIANNAYGCNSQEQVLEACAVGIDEATDQSLLTIYPNPAENGIITVAVKNTQTNLNLTCFNALGQKVYNTDISNAKSVIHVSNWQSGIYSALLSADGKIVGKAQFIVK